MERLDARTASFFAIGLLVFSFGCKGAGALKAIGRGAATAAKVAVAGAAVASAVNKGGGRAPREGGEVEAIPVRAEVECAVTCPMIVDGRSVYVCAREEAISDGTGWRRVYVCPRQDMAANY